MHPNATAPRSHAGQSHSSGSARWVRPLAGLSPAQGSNRALLEPWYSPVCQSANGVTICRCQSNQSSDNGPRLEQQLCCSATLFVPPPAVAQPCGLTALSPSLAKGHRRVGQGCPIWMPVDTGLTDSPEQGGEGTLPEGSHTRHPCARERPWCSGLGCQTHMQSRRELQGQATLPHHAGPPAPEATCW